MFNGTPGVFARSQDPIIVPQAPYNSAYNGNFPAGTTAYERIQSTSLTFSPLNLATPALGDLAAPVTIVNRPKAIAEEFNTDWGRMAAYLGVEVPFTNGMNQTTIFYRLSDPVTEIIDDTTVGTQIGQAGDGTQLWKITHNGVDTHPVHFHLFNVQIVNRVDWAGVVKPAEPNELGWKETVRMNPLEDIIVALRPYSAKVPFGQPDSVRPLDPTMPTGWTTASDPAAKHMFRNVDPQGNPVTVVNNPYNFMHEFVWHCHILSHEEMDMMRPIQFNVARELPLASNLAGGWGLGPQVLLSWTDGTPPATSLGNPANEIGYSIERADVINNVIGAFAQIGTALANATSFGDPSAVITNAYAYKVIAYNAAGDTVLGPVIVNAPTALGITCQGNINVNADPGVCGAVVAAAAALPAVTGGIQPIGTVPTGLPAGNLFPVGTTTVTWMATDAIGATAQCSFTVTVVDNQNPTIIAPANVAVNTDPGSTNATNVNLGTPTTADNCGVASVTNDHPSTTYPAGVTTVTWTVTDSAGLTATATQTVTVTQTQVPARPTGLAASNASAGTQPNGLYVRLSWMDNATTETGFVVERSVNGSGVWAQVGAPGPRAGTGSVTFNDNTAPANTALRYRVSAVNGAGSSLPSNEATITTLIVPGTPTNVTAVAVRAGTSDTVTISWTDVANETRYRLERATNAAYTSGLNVANPGANTTSVNQTGRPRNVTYWYRLRAERVTNGVTTWSPWVYPTPNPITTP